MKKFYFTNDKGFTLIEILVVVAILGVLATIVLVVLGQSRDKGSDAKIRSHLGQMGNQALLFNGTMGTGYVVPTPYQVSAGITGAATNGTPASGTLFNTTNPALNSLFSLASRLPGNTYVYYGWDGVNPNAAGRWFFAATLSTGAFCRDWRNDRKEYTGTQISSGPTNVANWTHLTVFPNATAANGSCN